MKVLLLGEYSGLHATLAQGLRQLGHDVTVASDGDGWKDLPRDIYLDRFAKYGKLKMLVNICRNWNRFKGYDVVQLINSDFLLTHPRYSKWAFSYLKKHNKRIFLGANGYDYVYINYACRGHLPETIFCDENMKTDEVVNNLINDYHMEVNKSLNLNIASQVDGITACCAEYKMAYDEAFQGKTVFIPLPVRTDEFSYCNTICNKVQKVKIFIGMMKGRRGLKGTQIIYDTLVKLQEKYPNDVSIEVADSIPYAQYTQMLNDSHILCDQLFAYGLGLNGIIGLSKGLIVAGGGKDSMYKLFGEQDGPIINLQNNEDEIFKALEDVILNKKNLLRRAKASREFAIKHHDYIKVTQRYLDFWCGRG